MRITIIGSGYVGLVAGLCFSSVGHEVVCSDNNEVVISKLSSGVPTIFEPGLKDLLENSCNLLTENGRAGIRFTSEIGKAGIESADVVFICIGSVVEDNGSTDLAALEEVIVQIAQKIRKFTIIALKSTFPPGTAKYVEEIMQRNVSPEISFIVVSNPEFMKEGHAVEDFLRPDRVVVGCNKNDLDDVQCIFRDLYAPFMLDKEKIMFMNRPSAELCKYAANAMLAARVSFMNEIAELAEEIGASIDDVRLGVGTDSRIGGFHLSAGPGYGGSCLPKDMHALIKTAKSNGVQLKIVEAVEEVNNYQRSRFMDKILEFYGNGLEAKEFAVWGAAFKARTDDVRFSPAIEIIQALLNNGAKIRLYDPEATENAKEIFGDAIVYFSDMYTCVDGADALVIMTEWNEFRAPNFKMLEKLKDSAIFDARNLF